MTNFGNNEFTQVKDISGRRRMPRLGKIRLGAKAKKGETEYPIELPFFLLPDEVAARYGMGDVALERAKELGVTRKDVLAFIENNGHRLAEELPVMLPMDDQSVVFPQSYRLYGLSRGAKCIGNGENAVEMEYDETGRPTGRKETECPVRRKDDSDPEPPRPEDCAKGKCSLKGFLMVMLPEVNPGGIYQITVGSFNSVVDVNSGIDYAKELIGRAARVPMKLRRIPTITHGSGRQETHYTLQLLLAIPENLLEGARSDNDRIISHSKMLALPAPEDVAPEFDDGEVIEVEAEDVEVSQDEQNGGQGVLTDPSPPNRCYETAETVLEGNSELVAPGDLGIINALLNTQKAPKGEYDRCCHVADLLKINIEDLPSLQALTYDNAQRLLGMLKKGGGG